MEGLRPIYDQYRTSEYIYITKDPGYKISKVLKIFDASQQCIFKTSYAPEYNSFQVISGDTTPCFLLFLKGLVEGKILDKKYLPEVLGSVSREDCIKNVEQMIKKFTPQIMEHKESKGFTCPILDDFTSNPVMTLCGHTFDEKAIKEWLGKNKTCPECRKPVNEDSLLPNYAVKHVKEDKKPGDPIPTFSLFQKENSKLARKQIDMALECAREGEFKDAVEFYAKALQYTKNWPDYEKLALVYELMGEFEKTRLVYLYLTLYQLQDEKVARAIETLETCQKGKTAHPKMDLLLFKLYSHNKQLGKGLSVAMEAAEALSDEPEEAISLLKQAIALKPQHMPLYPALAGLQKNPREKAQTYLQVACSALDEQNYSAAKLFCGMAAKLCEGSFWDELISIKILQQQKDLPGIKEKLRSLVDAFEKSSQTAHMLKACKMLFQLEKKTEYCRKIIEAYESFKKPHKQIEWYIVWLNLLIEEKNWPQAAQVAQEALIKANEDQSISIYEKLEVVHTSWETKELEKVWSILGKSYLQRKQYAAAEKVYRKAKEKFGKFEYALATAEMVGFQGRVQESVRAYYEASAEALLDERIDHAELCVHKIKEINPRMQMLETSERMHLLTQTQIFKLSRKLHETQDNFLRFKAQTSQALEEKTLEIKKLSEDFIEIQQKLQKTNKEFIGIHKDLTEIRLDGTDRNIRIGDVEKTQNVMSKGLTQTQKALDNVRKKVDLAAKGLQDVRNKSDQTWRESGGLKGKVDLAEKRLQGIRSEVDQLCKYSARKGLHVQKSDAL